jgi:hypothetical protein
MSCGTKGSKGWLNYNGTFLRQSVLTVRAGSNDSSGTQTSGIAPGAMPPWAKKEWCSLARKKSMPQALSKSRNDWASIRCGVEKRSFIVADCNGNRLFSRSAPGYRLEKFLSRGVFKRRSSCRTRRETALKKRVGGTQLRPVYWAMKLQTLGRAAAPSMAAPTWKPIA